MTAQSEPTFPKLGPYGLLIAPACVTNLATLRPERACQIVKTTAAQRVVPSSKPALWFMASAPIGSYRQ